MSDHEPYRIGGARPHVEDVPTPVPDRDPSTTVPEGPGRTTVNLRTLPFISAFLILLGAVVITLTGGAPDEEEVDVFLRAAESHRVALDAGRQVDELLVSEVTGEGDPDAIEAGIWEDLDRASELGRYPMSDSTRTRLQGWYDEMRAGAEPTSGRPGGLTAWDQAHSTTRHGAESRSTVTEALATLAPPQAPTLIAAGLMILLAASLVVISWRGRRRASAAVGLVAVLLGLWILAVLPSSRSELAQEESDYDRITLVRSVATTDLHRDLQVVFGVEEPYSRHWEQEVGQLLPDRFADVSTQVSEARSAFGILSDTQRREALATYPDDWQPLFERLDAETVAGEERLAALLAPDSDLHHPVTLPAWAMAVAAAAAAALTTRGPSRPALPGTDREETA